MNQLNSVVMTDPFGKESVCAQFVVDDTTDKFNIPDVLTPNTEYTVRCWAKCEGYEGGSTSSIILGSQRIEIGDGWTECQSTFTVDFDMPLDIHFGDHCTYYIYHLQLEQGNRATDWAPAPEDAEEAADNAHHAAIGAQGTADAAQSTAVDAKATAEAAQKTAADAIASLELQEGRITALVEGAVNASMMQQTENGWVFSMGAFTSQIDSLRDSLSPLTNRVKIGTHYIDGDPNNTNDANTEACIELAEGDTNFKVQITNTHFYLTDGPITQTSIHKDGIDTENVSASGEIRQTNPQANAGYFVWAMRQNGNYGLTWKGGV